VVSPTLPIYKVRLHDADLAMTAALATMDEQKIRDASLHLSVMLCQYSTLAIKEEDSHERRHIIEALQKAARVMVPQKSPQTVHSHDGSTEEQMRTGHA